MRRVRESGLAMVLAPIAISQHNCEAAGFKTPRAFLEFVSAKKLPHTRDGKTVMVAADVLLAALRGAPEIEVANTDEDAAPANVESLLARLGRRRIA